MLEELVQQAAPLLPEQVGSGQAAVSADHAQVGDAALDQVVRGLQPALVAAELLTAGAADDGSALQEAPITGTLTVHSALLEERCNDEGSNKQMVRGAVGNLWAEL